MTPAEELTAAAEKLRALAEAAAGRSGSTTWQAVKHFPGQPAADFTSLWAAGGEPLLRGGGGRGRPPAYVHTPVGDYIALMGPGVGLALADLLDANARFASLHARLWEASGGGAMAEADLDHAVRAALAAARQILGGDR